MPWMMALPVQMAKCTGCGVLRDQCPTNAITIKGSGGPGGLRRTPGGRSSPPQRRTPGIGSVVRPDPRNPPSEIKPRSVGIALPMEAATAAATEATLVWDADDTTPDQLTPRRLNQRLHAGRRADARERDGHHAAGALAGVRRAAPRTSLHAAPIPRFTLRLAADIWWILYVALHDLVKSS